MSEHAISIRNVHKRFGATHAVRDLSLSVPRGSLCGFLGPNGAGKSTTIRMIMSIIYPDSGSIDVLGSSAIANKDRIGYLPEERGVYRKMRVAEFLHYMGTLKGLRGAHLTRAVNDWLDRIELPGVARKRCQELSKGMQQKVQFIAAVIHQPDLLILDEPFSGLDPVNAQLMLRLFREIHQAGTTIIFSTHVLHTAEALCDRIFLINHGVKLLDASLDDIRRQYDPRTIGVVPMNGAMALQGLPGVVEVAPEKDGDRLNVLLDGSVAPHEIMQRIVAATPVRSIELRQITLEEVFVRLVLEDQGVDAARKAREDLMHG